MSTELEACLPVELRGGVITTVSAGMSGAGVYRVDVGGRAYVLKVAPKLRVDVLRADAGVAPRVVHVDEARHAVLSEHVNAQPFIGRLADPTTRAAAIGELGATLRRVHAITIPPGTATTDARAILSDAWAALAGFPVPEWVEIAVRRAIDAPPPPADRAPVLSHNDLNPSNLMHDGTQLLLLDWDAAGVNDALYDLATVAVFLRMNDAGAAALIAAHDQAPIEPRLPARFTYWRRVVAALTGSLLLGMARAGGHAGATEPSEVPTLNELYERMRSGTLNPRATDGQWVFGQALIKTSAQ